MAEEQDPQANALDPTVIESVSSELGQLEQRLIDEAIKQGLITAAQGTIVLQTVCAEPKIDAEGTIAAMVSRGLITEDAGVTLLEQITDDFVPGYQLGKELGRGAMGVVYEGTQRKLNRKVALKVVNPALSSDPDYVKRFKREALALAKLNHPNIVQVYDYGEIEGRIFLALEFVEGEDCADLIKREGPVSEALAGRIVHQSAMGLSHAKQAGIIHRDIKPANLLVTRSTDASTETISAKVTDLGLAREAKSDGDAELTKAGTILGTPAYMAPEQTRGEPADHRSDIYALGATFYHMLTGELPYHDTSVVNVIIKKRTEQLTNPQLLVPALSDGAVRVLDRMLAREPEHRYQDYEQLVADLSNVISGEQVMTPPVPRDHSCLDLDPKSTVARPTTKIVPRPEAQAGSPIPALAAIAVLAVVIVVVVAATKKTPAVNDPGAKTGVTTVGKDPDANVPTALAGLSDRLAALETAPPKVVLNQLTVLKTLKQEIEELPAGPRQKLTIQWQSILAQALEKTRKASTRAASQTWKAGQYERLRTLIAQALEPYTLLGHDPPARWVELGKKADAALTNRAGRAERKAWADARAEWEKPKDERDAIKVIGLLEGFHDRFRAFSPVLKQARRLLREAELISPQLILRTVPKTATITLMGKQVGTGSFEGRVAAGSYLVRANAPGYFELKRTIEVGSRTAETLHLGPKPARKLTQDTELGPPRKGRVFSPGNKDRAKFSTQWTPVGGWSPLSSGFVGVGQGEDSPATVRRDLQESLTLIQQKAKSTTPPGWSFSWRQQLKRPARKPTDPTPAEVVAAQLEVQFLEGAEHTPILRFKNGWLTLLIKVGEEQRILTSVDYRTRKQIPRSFRIDFDTKIAVVRLNEKILHSFSVDWGAQPVVAYRVAQGEVYLFDFGLFGLRPE